MARTGCVGQLLKCVTCSRSWTSKKRKVTAVKAPQRMMVNLWKVKAPMTLSAPTLVAVSIDSTVRFAVVGRFIPYWGPVVIEGHFCFELLLELNSPVVIWRAWELSRIGLLK